MSLNKLEDFPEIKRYIQQIEEIKIIVLEYYWYQSQRCSVNFIKTSDPGEALPPSRLISVFSVYYI